MLKIPDLLLSRFCKSSLENVYTYNSFKLDGVSDIMSCFQIRAIAFLVKICGCTSWGFQSSLRGKISFFQRQVLENEKYSAER